VPHFFVSPKNIIAGAFILGPEESAHLARVLRKKTGDEVRLFDGVDRSYRGVLDLVTPERVSGRILAEGVEGQAPYFLRLFQSVPKGDRFEWIIEKATELGVSEIVPLQTLRSVVRVSAERSAAKRVRWEKIVRAAAAQCGRADVPALSLPQDFDAALDRIKTDEVFLLAWEGEETKTLKSALSSLKDSGRRPVPVNVMIGPEGGFDPAEVERARGRGAELVSLGPRILRTETAGIFLASSLLYEFGL
jgi:16S rRNA (uracil1498-N3)-methyltransferase